MQTSTDGIWYWVVTGAGSADGLLPPRKLPDVTVSRVIKIREMLTQMHDYKQAVPRSYR